MSDKAKKLELSKICDELLVISKNKEKEIKSLENIKTLLAHSKQQIERFNKRFTSEYLAKIRVAIKDCINKERVAKTEGVENFKTERIHGIGSDEWKKFIVAASQFAKMQKPDNLTYPSHDDNCLLCQQSLSTEAQKLLTSYWDFINSANEVASKIANEKLTKALVDYQSLVFDLFPENNSLTNWLVENKNDVITDLRQKLQEQSLLTTDIVSDITTKSINDRNPLIIDLTPIDEIIAEIECSIKRLRNDEQNKELNRLQNELTLIAHKEKLNAYFPAIESFVANQRWIETAQSKKFTKLKKIITEKEKYISGKYFNQRYIDTFNTECAQLNGNFGIDVNHTGSGGTSYRQFSLKGKSPTAILSEGEQKVIALADFLTEMQLSEINRGIIFDDPVNSLDDNRKKDIALRLINVAKNKQVIIFTHDLMFVSLLITSCEDEQINHLCHRVENREGNAGQIWLNNVPSYEKSYRNPELAKQYYRRANEDKCAPTERENLVKAGFTALRTCYEVLVAYELFNNVVQRFGDRISIDSLKGVRFDEELKLEVIDCFMLCSRYMEGHSHSDKYAYIKPDPKNLKEEIDRYETLKSKIKNIKKK